jgi:hypothetical protein
MLARQGKAPESILKHPDQVGAAKENQSSAASPSASLITVSAPIITASADKNITTAAIKNTAASNTSGPQYRYSTPIKNPAIILKVVNHALCKGNPNSLDKPRCSQDLVRGNPK